MLEFRLLGRLEATADGVALAPGSGKQRALLAFLLLQRNRAVSRETLIDALWGDAPPATAAHALDVYVSRLRKALPSEGLLETRRGAFVLNVPDEAVDIARFDRLLAEARAATEAARRLAALDEALALWRGQALADVLAEPFAHSESERPEEERLVASEERFEALLALGRHDEAIGALQSFTTMHPLRERPRRQLMLALYRAGRQSEALAAYRDTRAMLRDELGLEPSTELRELEAAILRQDKTLTPPLRAADRTNLPVPATAFLGRERVLGEVTTLLQDGVRLLTLTGPAGTGKTRLALQTAGEVSDLFPEGLWWVPLGSLRDHRLLISEVAKLLGLGEMPGRDLDAAVGAALAGRRLLLLIDNAEHLLPELAETIGELHAARGPTIVVTSRGRLQVAGEHVFPVPPLDAHEAVELFTARARALDPGFEPDADVGELCTELDNLPLAIELAAARSTVLTPTQIRARLSERLDLLAGGRDADPRQRTLRSAIEWSHDLLAPQEQALFGRLSVFGGGCTLEAAEAVCAADIEALASLVDKSLVRRTGERYWMLATIGEFASERLRDSGEGEELAQRHLAHFLALAEDAAVGLRGAEQADWLARLDAEVDNFRVALDRTERLGAHEPGFAIANGLARFWEARSYWTEAGRRFGALLESSAGSPSPARARALFWLGRVSVFTAHGEGAEAQLTESAALARELGAEDTLALALGKAAFVASLAGRGDDASRRADESVATARQLGDDWVLAEALNDYSCVRLIAGDLASSRTAVLESLELRRSLGDTQNTIDSINNLGNLAMHEGRLDEAASLFDECIDLARSIGETRQLVLAGVNRGQIFLLSGQLDEASALLRENARLCLQCSDRRVGGATITALAALEVAAERMASAATLWGAGNELMGHLSEPDLEVMWERWLSRAEAALGHDAFDAAYRRGTQMPFERVVAYALSTDRDDQAPSGG
jgi:predicted ATPase/DNA-binding SARP family transcriptional activator